MRFQTMSMLGVHHNAELDVLQLWFQQQPSTAADDDILDFSHDDILFCQHFHSLLTYNDDDRGLLWCHSYQLAIARVRHCESREINMTTFHLPWYMK